MSTNDSWPRFLGIEHQPSDSDGEEFRTIPLDSSGTFRLGKAGSGHAALLVADPRGVTTAKSPLILANLSLRYGLDCQTCVEDSGPVTETLTVLECKSTSLTLQQAFVELAAALVGFYGEKLASGHIDELLERLVALLKSAASPSRTSIQGLWGELLLIAESADPETAVTSWHRAPSERFDFAGDGARCEVKTTAGETRSHLVQHRQLASPGSPIFLVSIMTAEQEGGVSVPDLVEDIIRNVGASSEAAVRLREVVAKSLGRDLDSAESISFDREMAVQSLKTFNAEDLPTIIEPIPAELSEIRYRIDLSAQTEADPRSCELLQSVLGLRAP